MAKIKTTKWDIICCAAELFFEQGYSATSPKHICEALDISTGNLTYYFPTKEHLLAVFVEMLCQMQWKILAREERAQITPEGVICLEIAAMAAMCEESESAKDFYLAAYTSPLCLEIIRRNDAQRNAAIFGSQLPDWTEDRFAEAETIISGIEYATLMTTSDSAPLETRIRGAADSILAVLQVPEEVREKEITKVLKTDYRKNSRRVLTDFKKFVAQSNETALEELINAKRRR